MPLQLKLITSPTDYPALASVRYAAFKDNTLNQLMYFSTVAPQTLQAWFVEREKRDAANPFQRIVAVIDTDLNDGEIIAYARCDLPSTLAGGAKVDLGPIPKVPEGTNEEIWRAFRAGVDGMRGKWGDVSQIFELHTLATHPSHQGRGAAGMLLRWVTEQADAAGKKSYLESTPVAYPLYCKYGWVKVDEVVIDLSRFGGQEDIVMAVMIREPRAAK